MRITTYPDRFNDSTDYGISRTSKFFSLLAAALLATSFFLTCQAKATAEVIVGVSEAQLIPGHLGFLDVYFMVSDETYSLAGYQVELILSGPDSGVRFTGFAEPPNAIFPGRKPIKTASRPELPGNIAAGNDFIFSGDNPIEDGAGIMRVLFETDIDSQGIYTVEVDTNIVRTNFSNGSGELIPIDLNESFDDS